MKTGDPSSCTCAYYAGRPELIDEGSSHWDRCPYDPNLDPALQDGRWYREAVAAAMEDVIHAARVLKSGEFTIASTIAPALARLDVLLGN